MLCKWESISEAESMGSGVCGDGCGDRYDEFEDEKVGVDGSWGDREGLRV